MVNFGPDFKNKIALSSSRIEKFKHCSQSYYANYILKLVDKGNAGSQKGDVIHNILEILSKNTPKRKSLVMDILRDNTCRNYLPLWNILVKYAVKNTVGIESELDIIDKYILVALNNEFYGPKGTFKILIEKDFDFEVVEGEKNYRIRGFIDKFIFVKIINDEIEMEIVDYKSSKAKFAAPKIQNSLQGMIYQLAAKYLFPEHKLRKFTFLFLKFPNEPQQEFKLLSEASLDGFEYELTQYQRLINNFNEKNIGDNLGIQKWETKFLCGPAKSGWICPHQKPLDYFAIINKGGEIVKTAFTEEELKPRVKIVEGEKLVKKKYFGCLYFHDQTTGAPRRLNFRNND